MTLKTAIELGSDRLELTRQELKRRAASLADDMTRLIRELDDESPSVNSIGEIQANGSHIDALCATFEEKKMALSILRNLKVDAS